MPTEAQVRQWRTLADKATPGPWVVSDDTMSGPGYKGLLAGAGYGLLEDCAVGEEADACFMAASREAVPAMGAMLERAAALIAEWAAEGDPYAEEWLVEWRGEGQP